MPASTILPGPILSVSMPATGMVSIAPMPCGASSSPACSVVSPRTCRKYDGNSRLAPKNAIANSDIAITETRQRPVAEQLQVDQRVLGRAEQRAQHEERRRARARSRR